MNSALCISESGLRIGVLKVLAAFALATGLQSLLTSGMVELPQKNDESLLSMISDDTRMVLSSSMMKKADAYFHGGVTEVNCSLESHAEEALMEGHDQDHHPENEVTEHHLISSSAALKKPFMWINSRIHAQEHRHMENEKSVELLPWVSAAVVASPHNIQAYESGSYILNRMSGKPELAVDFLQQGITNNPECAALELSLSEIYYNTLKDKTNAVVHLNRALQKNQAKKEELTKDDLFQRLKIYYYLGVAAKDEHDVNKLRTACQRAFEIDPDSVMTQSLFKRLKEEMKSPEQ